MNELIDRIESKADFIDFMTALNLESKQDSLHWHKSVRDYLEAIQSWVEDMDGYYLNQALPVPQDISWKVLAQILTAATVYE